MRICFLTTSYPLWEGHFKGHFVREAAVNLVELGHSVTVVAPGEFDSVPYEVDHGVVVYRFKYFPFKKVQCVTSGNGILPNIKNNRLSALQIPIFFSSFFWHAVRLSHGHDVIHAHWSVSGLPGLWCKKMKNVPVVLSLRGSDYSINPHSLLNHFSNRIVKRVDGIIAENGRLHRSALQAGVSTHRVLTLRNGVDLYRFSPQKNRSVLSGTGAEGAKKVILFVGRLTPVKGPDIALSAFEHILSVHPDSCLVMVGDGELKEELMHRVKSSNRLKQRVVFTGEISTHTVSAYYHAADLLIISSRSEGTPNVLLEAMASGIPVVSVPVGGVPEVIQHNISGIIASKINDQSLGERIIDVLNDDNFAREVGASARTWAEGNLSWKKTVKDYISMYHSAMDSFKQ